MTEPLSVTQLAYVAALIDTRANLTTRRARDAVLPQVEISGRPFPALEWLGQITGVRVVPTQRAFVKVGCSEHCAEKHIHVSSLSGRWFVSGAKATIVLAAVRPYLMLRRGQVDDLIDLGRQVGHKGATVTEMAALGWPVEALRP